MNKKNLLFLSIMFISSYTIASGIITTFVNSTQLDIKLEVHFSDSSITKKIISMAQSYQVVNFKDRKIDYILFSSDDKDNNGNMYNELRQNFSIEEKNSVYTIGLKDIAPYKVPAALHTEAFEMPTTQAITCVKNQ